METSVLNMIRDWSIATLAVVAFASILYFFIKEAFGILKKMQDEHRDDQKWFKEFVNTNNHQKTEMVKEHTQAMVEVGINITANTKAIEKLMDKVDRI